MESSLTFGDSVGADDSAGATRPFPTSTAHFVAESNQPYHPPPAGPMSIAWGLSGVGDQNFQLNPTLFRFIVPATMIPAPDSTSGHHSHLLHAPIDADFAYGSELVTPSSMQFCGHYGSGSPGHWDGTLNHGTSTPKVSIPTRQVTRNPRAQVDEAPQDNNPTPTSQPKRTLQR